jgi:hypothetical protein
MLHAATADGFSEFVAGLVEFTSVGMRGIVGLRRHHSDRFFDHFNRHSIVVSQRPRRFSSPESIPYD